MIKSHNYFFWFSGLFLGLAVCAFFSCPLWKVAVPAMLILSVVTGITAFKKMKVPDAS